MSDDLELDAHQHEAGPENESKPARRKRAEPPPPEAQE